MKPFRLSGFLMATQSPDCLPHLAFSSLRHTHQNNTSSPSIDSNSTRGLGSGIAVRGSSKWKFLLPRVCNFTVQSVFDNVIGLLMWMKMNHLLAVSSCPFFHFLFISVYLSSFLRHLCRFLVNPVTRTGTMQSRTGDAA